MPARAAAVWRNGSDRMCVRPLARGYGLVRVDVVGSTSTYMRKHAPAVGPGGTFVVCALLCARASVYALMIYEVLADTCNGL